MADIAEDIVDITTSSDEFADPITFATPAAIDPPVTVTINGIAIRHSTAVNDMGAGVIGKIARVTICEAALVAAGYPTRNADNKIALVNHKVSYSDANGDTYNAVIREVVPSHKFGLIVCHLGDNKA